jgi:ATP-dependent DNA helicase RecG
MDEFDWLRTREEGQFLERKGCYDRSDGKFKRRNVRDVADDVAETLMAMANADGGTLVVGIEDDGTVSGLDYPDDRVAVILEAPQLVSCRR